MGELAGFCGDQFLVATFKNYKSGFLARIYNFEIPTIATLFARQTMVLAELGMTSG
jgi:hypothetical protein